MTRPNQGIGAANVTITSGTGTNPPNSQNDTQTIQPGSAPSSGALASTVTSSTTISPTSTVMPTSQAIPTSGTAASMVAATTQAMPTMGETSNQGGWNFGTVSHRSVPPGRPTTSMLGLHTSQASSS